MARITGAALMKLGRAPTMWTTGGVPFAGIFRLGPEAHNLLRFDDAFPDDLHLLRREIL